MADILSVTGSVLAVLGLAVQSCEVLCKFLRSFHEAAGDLEHHIATLQALKSAFARISDLERDFTNHDWVGQPFSSRLQDCLLDLKAMEDFVVPVHNEMLNGRARRVWMKTKWAGANQKQRIESFMARIESYYMTFSLDLLMINTRLTLQLRSPKEVSMCQKLIVCPPDSVQEETQVSSTRAPQVLIELAQGSCISFANEYRDIVAAANNRRLLRAKFEENASPSACQSFGIDTGLVGPPVNIDASATQLEGQSMPLATPAPSFRLEATSFRDVILWKSENPILPLSWWLGQIKVDKAMENRGTSRIAKFDRGYRAGFFVALPWNFSLRYELLIYFWRKGPEPSLSFSLDSYLSFPRLISWDTRSVHSVMCGDLETMKTEFGLQEATPFDVMPDGSTLLHLAAMQNQFAMVKFLIEQGARVDATNSVGESPLHRAIQLAKDYRITRLLLDQGGDLCTLTIARKTPLHTFFNNVVEQTILTCASGPLLSEFLIPDGHGRTLLHYLSWSSKTSVDTFKLILTRNPDYIGILDSEGRSVLHFSAQRGNSSLIAYILSTTSALDLNGRDCKGMAPIHYAVESRRAAETIETLARHGANPGAREDKGRSALHLAAKRDNLLAMEALLKLYSAPIVELQVADQYGLTPMHVAEQSGSNTVRPFLIDYLGGKNEDASSHQQPGSRKRYCCCQNQRQQYGDDLPNLQEKTYSWYWTDIVEGGKKASERVSGAVLYLMAAFSRLPSRPGPAVLSVTIVILLGLLLRL